MASSKFTQAVEAYFTDLRLVRGSGGATNERSLYVPLANLLNAVGGALRPKVFCVQELADQGVGHPDFGLYTTQQVQKGKPKSGQKPERGVVEVKPVADDAWLTASGNQGSRYWDGYRRVLVTNARDFAVMGEDASGQPVRLETFRIAASDVEFNARLERPRAFAREVGAGLGEYLGRVLSHSTSLSEPKDVAWLLASYARDGLARVEAASDTTSLAVARTALEESLGVRFEGDDGAAFFRSTWCRPCSTGSSPPGSCGPGRRRHPLALSTGTALSGTCALRCSARCSSRSRTRAGCSPWAWWKCWTGRPRP